MQKTEFNFEIKGNYNLEILTSFKYYPSSIDEGHQLGTVYSNFNSNQYWVTDTEEDAHTLAKLLKATEYRIGKLQPNESYYHNDIIFMTPLVKEIQETEKQIKAQEDAAKLKRKQDNEKALAATPSRQILMQLSGPKFCALVLDWKRQPTGSTHPTEELYVNLGFVKTLEDKQIEYTYQIEDFVSINGRVMAKKAGSRLAQWGLKEHEIVMFLAGIKNFLEMKRKLHSLR